MGYIYIFTNKINGKQYVGMTTKTIEKRFVEYKRSFKIKNKRPINYAIIRYGFDGFNIHIEEYNLSEKELLKIEADYIKKYNTLVPNGYNVSEFGSEINKEYLSKLRKQHSQFIRIGKPDWKKIYNNDIYSKYNSSWYSVSRDIVYRRETEFVELYEFIYIIARKYARYKTELFEELANDALDLLEYFSGKKLDNNIIRDELIKNIRQNYEAKKKYDPYASNKTIEVQVDDDEDSEIEERPNHLFGKYSQKISIYDFIKKRKNEIETNKTAYLKASKEHIDKLINKVKEKRERNSWRY